MVETRNSKLNQNKSTVRTVGKRTLKHIETEISTQPTKRARKKKETIVKEETVESESGVTKIEPTQSRIHTKLAAQASKKRAAILVKYLRVEEYDRGDIILGIRVPDVRSISKDLGFLPFTILKELINSKYHEERLLSVINLVDKYKISKDPEEKKNLFEFYLNDMREGIDNWDLVDISASHVVGSYLIDKPELKKTWLFERLLNSERLWDRRIAIVSTLYFINQGQFEDTTKLSEILLNDEKDLIHKATGWMLREVGKKSKKNLVNFLDKYAVKMPRVMLRYSLEKFSDQEKKKYMQKGKK
ncbi:1808_t:CDS:2 [Funneliformis geosporum]|uniref:16463_t:CDS:1 n=1 Tax=Funneliformis geosporum TaxID=1117311 RepID=A0A9W4SDF1_9GLOM|nr:1808_t:CDS:2 [Funneliformis geosporum]CAI2165643.1 16463_t:CDS:2 [Funneliformis geosporum]